MIWVEYEDNGLNKIVQFVMLRCFPLKLSWSMDDFLVETVRNEIVSGSHSLHIVALSCLSKLLFACQSSIAYCTKVKCFKNQYKCSWRFLALAIIESDRSVRNCSYNADCFNLFEKFLQGLKYDKGIILRGEYIKSYYMNIENILMSLYYGIILRWIVFIGWIFWQK